MHPNADLNVNITPENVHETLARHMLADGFPLVYDDIRSQGVRIFDSRTGRTFLDFFGFFGSSPLGSNHPAMLEPGFVSQMARLALHNPTNSDIYTVEMAEFVETFARFAVPAELPHLFFVAGGTLAVENAFKVAMDWKVRKNFAKGHTKEVGQKILHFQDAFHGRSGYTLTCTNTADPRKHMYFAKLDWPRVSNPKARFPLTGANLRATIAAEEESIRQIEAAFERDGDDICAIVIEPIQGEGGDNHFRPEFHKALRTIADERDVMLIYDEVQSGFGATGKLWAFEHYGIIPDIVAFGKKTQVCGIMVSRRVDEVPNNVFVESTRINSTWGGNLIDMARCTRYMQVMQEGDLIAKSAKVGEVLLAGLERLAATYPAYIANPRGKGTFCAFDLPSAEFRGKLIAACYDAGVIVIGCGASSIRFRPPLILTEADVEEGLGLIEEALRTLV